MIDLVKMLQIFAVVFVLTFMFWMLFFGMVKGLQ